MLTKEEIAASAAYRDKALRHIRYVIHPDHARQLIGALNYQMQVGRTRVTPAEPSEETKARWDEWLATMCIDGRRCILCNRKTNYKIFLKYYHINLDVLVLHGGQKFLVRACSPECRATAADNFERTKQWLQQQRTDLRAIKRIQTIMSQEVSKLLKKESRRAKSSRVS